MRDLRASSTRSCLYGTVALLCVLADRPTARAEPADGQKRPTTRVLTWAQPGTDGDLLAPENWLERGAEAEMEPDATADIVLPDAEKPYVASLKWTGRRRKLACRHVRIGRNAGLDLGYKVDNFINVSELVVGGDVDVGPSGYVYAALTFTGARHTVCRVDAAAAQQAVFSIMVAKTNESSVTMLTRGFGAAYGIEVRSGVLVVGEDADLRCALGLAQREKARLFRSWEGSVAGGNHARSYFHVFPGARLELLSGAVAGRSTNVPNVGREGIEEVGRREGEVLSAIAQPGPDFRIHGLLRAGSPEHPLTRDATLELTCGTGPASWLRHPGGLYVCEDGDLRIHSADPSKARLVVTALQEDVKPEGARLGVSAYFARDVSLDGVHWDYLRQGGIQVRDVSRARSGWRHMSFDAHNATAPETLLAELGKDATIGKTGKIELVDGAAFECELVMEHSGLLIVRSLRNGTTQSFPLPEVHATTVDGRRTVSNPRRELTAAEQAARAEVLWADAPPRPAELPVPEYVRQEWAKAPLLIWAEPGRSGDIMAGANWVGEDGRPPFDTGGHEVDLLLPASEKPYRVYSSDICYSVIPPAQRGYHCGYAVDRPYPKLMLRHLTVERNAIWRGTPLVLPGNFWIKRGGAAPVNNDLMFVENGGRHAFARVEHVEPIRPRDYDRPRDKPRLEQVCFSHHVRMYRPQGTMELVGTMALHDKFMIHKGTLLISEDSWVASGDRTPVTVFPGATLALMSGASIQKWGNMIGSQMRGADIVCSGTLCAGTPERPIVKDTVLALGAHAKVQPTQGQYVFQGVSMFIGATGALRVHSVDPASARLVLTWRGPCGEAFANGKIGLSIEGRAELDGVHFDAFNKGGILVRDLALPRTWKRVTYGPANASEPDALFTLINQPMSAPSRDAIRW